MSKFSVIVEEFTSLRSNTLFGFVTITVPELHLKIRDLTVHQQGDSRWVGLPGKPQIDKGGNTKRDDRGKIIYLPVLQFTDKAAREAFSARVIAALLEFAPSAFE